MRKVDQQQSRKRQQLRKTSKRYGAGVHTSRREGLRAAIERMNRRDARTAARLDARARVDV